MATENLRLNQIHPHISIHKNSHKNDNKLGNMSSIVQNVISVLVCNFLLQHLKQ